MLNIIFLGTPDFSVPCFNHCHQSQQLNILAVVTQPDRPSGRGQKLVETPVKQAALAHGYRVYQPSKIRNDEELLATLRDLKPDFFVTIAFGQILSQEVLDIPKHGTVNVHASLLPKYRGANPIQASIVAGETETGLTTMMTELGVDTGPMLLKHTEAIGPTDTSAELFERLSQAGGTLLENSLVALAAGEITPQQQDDALTTHAPKAKKEDAIIDWAQPAQQLDWKIRGQQPWPGASTLVNGEVLKLRRSCMPSAYEYDLTDTTPGTVIGPTDSGVLVQCADGPLCLLEVQPAGKATMPAKSWWNGLQGKLNGQPLILTAPQPVGAR